MTGVGWGTNAGCDVLVPHKVQPDCKCYYTPRVSKKQLFLSDVFVGMYSIDTLEYIAGALGCELVISFKKI